MLPYPTERGEHEQIEGDEETHAQSDVHITAHSIALGTERES